MGFFRRLKNIAATAVGLRNPIAGAAMIAGKQIQRGKAGRAQQAQIEQAEFDRAMAAVGPQDAEQIRSGVKIGAPDLSALIAERERQSGGFTAPEAEAFRSQMALGMQGQEAQQRRALAAAQARSGVRGGAMSAQAARLALGQGQQRAAGEQELFLKNVAEQQRRFGELEKLRKDQMFAQQAAELAREQMVQQELASRRAAGASIYAARRASAKK